MTKAIPEELTNLVMEALYSTTDDCQLQVDILHWALMETLVELDLQAIRKASLKIIKDLTEECLP